MKKTIGELSLFGLAMGIATVFVIPSNIEPLFWLVIFAISASVIARRCSDRHFVQILLVGLANCVWVTGAHVLFFHQYIANHPQEAAMMASAARFSAIDDGDGWSVVGAVSGAVMEFSRSWPASCCVATPRPSRRHR